MLELHRAAEAIDHERSRLVPADRGPDPGKPVLLADPPRQAARARRGSRTSRPGRSSPRRGSPARSPAAPGARDRPAASRRPGHGSADGPRLARAGRRHECGPSGRPSAAWNAGEVSRCSAGLRASDASRAARGSSDRSAGSSSRNAARQLGSGTTTGIPRDVHGSRTSRRRARRPAGQPEHPGVVERSGRSRPTPRAPPPAPRRASRTATRSTATGGRKASVNVSGQTTTVASLIVPAGRGDAAAAERAPGEARHGPRGRQPREPAHCPPEPGGAQHGVGQPRHAGRHARRPGQEPQGIHRPGAQPAGVVVVEELGLVGGHVHLGRAVDGAALAREAQVQRIAHVAAAPGGRGRLALEHLDEQLRAATRRVPLVARDAERRAHRPGVIAQAAAHADASLGRPLERVPSAPEHERRWPEVRRPVAGPAGKVRVERVGVHDLARVHPAARDRRRP